MRRPPPSGTSAQLDRLAPAPVAIRRSSVWECMGAFFIPLAAVFDFRSLTAFSAECEYGMHVSSFLVRGFGKLANEFVLKGDNLLIWCSSRPGGNPLSFASTNLQISDGGSLPSLGGRANR
jgi:hypothetical protein